MNLLNVYNWAIRHLSKGTGYTCFFCETRIPALNNGLCAACLDDFPINRYACERCGISLPHTIHNIREISQTEILHKERPQTDRSYTKTSSTNASSTQSSWANSPETNDAQTNAPQIVAVRPKTYLCGNCITTPPAWHTLTALCQYEYPASNMIQALKYHAKFHNAKLLARMFIAELNSIPGLQIPQCILPVPLHPTRQRQRRFNQAIELARPIARALNIPLDINSCQRRADTPSQANLDQLTRLQNLQNAFILKRLPAYNHVAIFDDVVTTGSTVRSLCKLLHKAGVERVDVWCIARASRDYC